MQRANSRWDAVIVGAGAAGLLAAIRAAERGRRTLLLEKNTKPGVKILMSGGTRCNLTHATDRAGIVEAFGPQGKFLYSALAALSPQQVVEIFEAEGVRTKVEDTGKIFPESDRALDVQEALLRRLRRTDCTLALGEPLEEMQLAAEGFELRTPLRQLFAEKLLVTTGGQSYPGCGTTGDGYRWAADLGHTIVPPRPALVPITVDVPWVRELQGVTIPDVELRVIEPASAGGKDRLLTRRRGSFLFTHFGLSGPVALDVSREISGHAEPRKLALVCDFLPTMSEPALVEWFAQQAATAGRKQLASVLPEDLPRRLTTALLAVLSLPPERKAAELSKVDRGRLVKAIKQMLIPVSGTRGFKKAEVTAGGISLDEVDSRTMASKRVPNLYLAGEVLDLDGPIGGYNFQAAFSTGWLAGGSL